MARGKLDGPMIDPNILVRYARFKKADRNGLYELAAKHAPAVSFDRVSFEAHLDKIADDRLVFAQRMLLVSQEILAGNVKSSLLASNDEILLRSALSRAYYCVHHSLRALHLQFARWDPDGHYETVEATRDLLQKESALMNHLSPLGDLAARTVEALEERTLPTITSTGVTQIAYNRCNSAVRHQKLMFLLKIFSR